MVNVLLQSASRDIQTEVPLLFFSLAFSFIPFFFPFPNRLSPAPSELPFSLCVAAGPWQRLPAEGQGCSLGSDAAS